MSQPVRTASFCCQSVIWRLKGSGFISESWIADSGSDSAAHTDRKHCQSSSDALSGRQNVSD
ncbi:TPA_asm: hypothetical protein G0G78_09280 [Salmonella enterica]|nr:hypothetical protein [Salmonella enterica]EAO7619051.1 hypothetical protein [Salmonella enterica]EAQ6819467.1 hypothetical protein [Salmonella enterica]EAU9426967.1 hypothetical protein [Salmonella enterica]MIV19150.1 hypothetical protein [Salmonella enterica]